MQCVQDFVFVFVFVLVNVFVSVFVFVFLFEFVFVFVQVLGRSGETGPSAPPTTPRSSGSAI